jgi:HD superfamily phosphohydrolase
MVETYYIKMSKQIYDPVHGFITATPLMQKIMDTPEFQRLRDLKQLGAVHYVYPSATHTRFEHSLGVSHLAKIMASNLVNQMTYLNTPKEVVDIEKNRIIELCCIAGLIHDIGHGPYSHLYDTQVRSHDEPEHEERGCEIFKTMVEKYNFKLNKNEVRLIIDMIIPPASKKKCWLYQIIANKECQIDVDKIDYIQRDCYHTGLKFGGEWTRLLTQALIRSNVTQGNLTGAVDQIVWPKKLEYEIFQLFATRYRLHKQVYNHHTVKAYEYYIVQILRQAKYQKTRFLDMTDSLVTCRLHDEWREVQDRIAKRQIPKLVGETTISIEEHETKASDYTFPRTIVNLIIDHIKIGFASGDVNPLDKVILVDMHSELVKINKSDSICVPTNHREVVVRWYNSAPSLHAEAVQEFKNKYKQ